MTEEGRGSMHGCWSGSGSSSSRSTLERASSKVTVDVMLLKRTKESLLQPLSENEGHIPQMTTKHVSLKHKLYLTDANLNYSKVA